MGKKAPAAPDPMQVAGTQAQFSKEAAADTIKMNSINQTGPFGSSVFQKDSSGMPTGIKTTLAKPLQAGAQNTMGAFTDQTAGLPTSIDFDPMVAENIANRNYGAYSAMTAPDRAQQQNRLRTELEERGIPLTSEIETNARGNQDRQFAIADTNAAAQAWNAVPAHQAMMTNTAIEEAMSGGKLAGQSLGLLGGLKGLTPQANQPQAQVQPPNYENDAYRSAAINAQNHANDQGSLGKLLSAGAGLALSPMTGGFSNTLLGGLFNQKASSDSSLSGKW